MYGDDERFLMQQFQKSLTGPAHSKLAWFVHLDPQKIHTWSDLANAFLAQYRFNTEMAPDRFELQRMMKKVHESFRVYAQKWRELAAQVKPPVAEKEMVNAFLNTLKEPYYSHLLGHTTSSFADLVIVGERVEDGIKTGKLIDVQALQSLIEQSSASASARRPNPRRVDTRPKGGEVQNITSAPPRNNFPQKQAVYLQLAPTQPLVFAQPPVTPISPPAAQAQAINAPPPALI